MRLVGISGQRFGLLTVEKRVENSRQGQARWRLVCDCGGSTEASSADIRAGDVTSCGCRLKEIGRRVGMLSKHGHRSRRVGTGCSPTYESWRAMKARCLRPTHVAFPRYSAKQIAICDRWLNSFENFHADMGDRPEGLTLERIDNAGNYEPGNCKWATPKEQANNRDNNIARRQSLVCSASA